MRLGGGAYEGKFYAVPWINDTKFLFYNKKMLADAGFSAPPTTWDELVAQAKAIKDKGVVEFPIVWSLERRPRPRSATGRSWPR